MKPLDHTSELEMEAPHGIWRLIGIFRLVGSALLILTVFSYLLAVFKWNFTNTLEFVFFIFISTVFLVYHLTQGIREVGLHPALRKKRAMRLPGVLLPLIIVGLNFFMLYDVIIYGAEITRVLLFLLFFIPAVLVLMADLHLIRLNRMPNNHHEP